jgi:hypothetical protein
MVAAGILGGLALVMMQLSKSQNQQSVRSKVYLDLTQLKTEIQTYMTGPAHCNANFYNKTVGANFNPTAVYSCATTLTTNCGSSGGIANAKIPVFASGSAWAAPFDRVRVTGLVAYINPLTPIAPATKIISSASLKVSFQTKDMAGAKTMADFTYNTPVVLSNTGQILGCPKSLNSTVPY